MEWSYAEWAVGLLVSMVWMLLFGDKTPVYFKTPCYSEVQNSVHVCCGNVVLYSFTSCTYSFTSCTWNLDNQKMYSRVLLWPSLVDLPRHWNRDMLKYRMLTFCVDCVYELLVLVRGGSQSQCQWGWHPHVVGTCLEVLLEFQELLISKQHCSIIKSSMHSLDFCFG